MSLRNTAAVSPQPTPGQGAQLQPQPIPTLLEANTGSLRNRRRNGMVPAENEYRAIDDGGLYPAIEDPQFISRLLRKTEFAETKSDDFDPNSNPCEGGPEFELTPVQEFVSNFMSPRTPYMSCLLYHGVGVGKTATAIASAEAYLDMFPRRKVFIVCPRAIRSGFKRTIFDPKGVTIGQGDAANIARGPTGDTYLRFFWIWTVCKLYPKC